MSVRVDVINRTLVPICRKENTWGMRWPDTGPGSTALLECPRQFTGDKVSRICAMKDATTPMWQIPDFSQCLYQPLIYPYTKVRFILLILNIKLDLMFCQQVHTAYVLLFILYFNI